MASRFLLATAIAFTAGCVAVGLYEVIIGVYECNGGREPQKRPYEHDNHSDETLVDSNRESTKSREVHDSEGSSSVHHTPPAPGPGPNNSFGLNQTPTPPPTPPGAGRWPVRGHKPPKGHVIIFEDGVPPDEETSTPLSMLPPDVLGASFRKFEVQETIEQVFERM